MRIGNTSWNYLDSGTGDELWIGFHGFGQEAEVMQHFLSHLRPTARIMSFDLPYHGSTETRSTSLTAGDLSEMIGPLLQQHGTSSCTLVGFSLGGKVVLKLTELVPGVIARIVLIAPDGLRTNPIYWFATNTLLGRSCFQLVIHHPQPIFWFSALLSKTGLMDRRIDHFVGDQMGTEEKRQRVFNVWQMFKRVTPSLKEVKREISRYRIKTILVFGKQDRVIHPKLAKKLSGQNCPSAEVIMLNSGHRLLTREIAERLRESIA